MDEQTRAGLTALIGDGWRCDESRASIDEIVDSLVRTDFAAQPLVDTGVFEDMANAESFLLALCARVFRRWFVRGQRPSECKLEEIPARLVDRVLGIADGILTIAPEFASPVVVRLAFGVGLCSSNLDAIRLQNKHTDLFLKALPVGGYEHITRITLKEVRSPLDDLTKLCFLQRVKIDRINVGWDGGEATDLLSPLKDLSRLSHLQLDRVSTGADKRSRDGARGRSRGLGAEERARLGCAWSWLCDLQRLRSLRVDLVNIPSRLGSRLARALESLSALTELGLTMSRAHPPPLVDVRFSRLARLRHLTWSISTDMPDLHVLDELTRLDLAVVQSPRHLPSRVAEELNGMITSMHINIQGPALFWHHFRQDAETNVCERVTAVEDVRDSGDPVRAVFLHRCLCHDVLRA